MKRAADIIEQWHCVHPCRHKSDIAPRAWRYTVASGDVAFALMVSERGCLFVLHRAFKLPGDDRSGRFPSVVALDQDANGGSLPLGLMIDGTLTWGLCDLLEGGLCVADTHGPGDLPSSPSLSVVSQNDALEFWRKHGRAGTDQSERFWAALENEGERWAHAARQRRAVSRASKYRTGGGEP